ncbi:MAG: ATP-binding protein [Acidobacteriota bacterium]
MLRLGLRTKFFLYSNTLIVVTMGLVGVLAVLHERQTRYDAIVSRGRSVTEALAIPITDALMYEELGLVSETGLIDNYITEMIDRNRDLLRYVVVADPHGIVTHTNRWELAGERFTRALGRDAIGKPSEVEIREAPWGERILEVRTPLNISTKFWGTVAVGFSLAPIEGEVRTIANRVALVAVLLMLGNSMMTAVYVETLIRPILNLYQTMKRAGRGDYRARADVRRGDEVGELANAFNRMMDELEETREKEKVRQAQLAHTEKMAAVGTLAAGVAHEVNNPLAGILTCIETIEANPEDADLRNRYLALVSDGIRRIEHTVANLLNFSRPRAPQPEPTSLNHSLHHVAELVEYQLRKNNVEIRFDLDEEEPVVLADHFQMEQVLLNLVLNSIQAMPSGGTLTLRTRTLAEKVVAEVTDSGAGIPVAIRDRIFDPFFTTRDVGEGTGLGLSVSYNIVAAHGGSIDVETEVGKGSTFRVTLPVRQTSSGEGGTA